MSARIIPIALILIAIGLFFGYINPTYTGEIAQLKGEIKGYDGALEAAKRFTEKESSLVLERSSIPEEGLKRLEAFLPNGVNNVELILDLNALAARSGLQLSNFDVSPTDTTPNQARPDELSLTAEGPVESLDLTVSATGTYAAFKTFLRSVEWSLRPMDVTQIEVQDSQTGVYIYNLTLRIYWLR